MGVSWRHSTRFLDLLPEARTHAAGGSALLVRQDGANLGSQRRRVWRARGGPVAMYEDKTLTCRGCGQEFTFTAGEQEFYQQKGLMHEPGRCSECRATRRLSAQGERGPREM